MFERENFDREAESLRGRMFEREGFQDRGSSKGRLFKRESGREGGLV